jgi:hypothetical protein
LGFGLISGEVFISQTRGLNAQTINYSNSNTNTWRSKHNPKKSKVLGKTALFLYVQQILKVKSAQNLPLPQLPHEFPLI